MQKTTFKNVARRRTDTKIFCCGNALRGLEDSQKLVICSVNTIASLKVVPRCYTIKTFKAAILSHTSCRVTSP